jgi:hypothetical protein
MQAKYSFQQFSSLHHQTKDAQYFALFTEKEILLSLLALPFVSAKYFQLLAIPFVVIPAKDFCIGFISCLPFC